MGRSWRRSCEGCSILNGNTCGWTLPYAASFCLILLFCSLCSVGLNAQDRVDVADAPSASSPLRPAERLARAADRIAKQKVRIDSANALRERGKILAKERGREAKDISGQLSKVLKWYKREMNALSRPLQSKDREERNAAKEKSREVKQKYRAESKELKTALKQARKEQRRGNNMVIKGEAKLQRAKEALKRAKKYEKKVIKQNIESERKVIEYEKRRAARAVERDS